MKLPGQELEIRERPGTSAVVTRELQKSRRLSQPGLIRQFLTTLLLVYSIVLQIAAAVPTPTPPAETERPEVPAVSEVKNPEPQNQEVDPIDILGPVKVRRIGFQTRYLKHFSLSQDIIGPYKIKIESGSSPGFSRIYDGVVYLNDILLSGSGELNKETQVLEKSVQLYTDNVLDFTFLSRARVEFTVTVSGFRRRLPGRGQPVIQNFTPGVGYTGNTVTINGINLTSIQNGGSPGSPTVTFAGMNGTRRFATVSQATNTQVRVVVPGAVATGKIEVINAQGRAMSSSDYVVQDSLDYQITPMPASVSAVQLTSSTQLIAVTSPRPDFAQLVTLSAVGLPANVSATFEPPEITAGATSTLTLNLRKANLKPGSYDFNISGSAFVNGGALVRSASASLNVISAGTTNLTGRVLSTNSEPIMGATVSVQPEGRSTVTDAAGNFILTDVTAGTNRPIQIDGRTANMPNRTYPVIQEPANIMAGQTNENPYIYYLPPIDREYEVQINPTAPTVVTNGRLDDLTMTIPANAQLRNRDGTPVDRVSITPLEIDRTPAPLPPNLQTSIVYTAQPGGAVSANGTRIPVTFPNLGQADAGTQIELWAFNHDTVEWYRYGFGRVSSDGKTIVPEIDPSTGQPYGLPDFSWGFPATPPATDDGNSDNPSDPPEPPDDCQPGGNTANMVDLSTGLKVEQTTDIAFGGARGGLELTRYYNSDLPINFCDAGCPFGRGTSHNYNVRLTGTFNSNGSGRVAMPGEGNGRLFTFLRTEADGTLVFSTVGRIGQIGDTLRKLSDGSFEYRYKQGDLMKFNSNRRLTEMTDRNGNTTTLSYTGNNLTQITDPTGRSISLTYDASNRITTATDPLNRVWRYTYEGTPGVPGNPGLTTVTDPENYITRYRYVIGGRISSITDPRGNLVKQVTYNTAGRVTDQVFADNSRETYSYTLSGNEVTNAVVTNTNLLRRYQKRFNASGQVIEEVDELGQVSKYERNINNNQIIQSFFNQFGGVAAVAARGGTCGCNEDVKTYDDNGNLVQLTDRQGASIKYQYEPVFNKVSKVTDKLGRATHFAYDSRGNLVSVTNALNETTNYAYDLNGQLVSVTSPLNQVTTFQYDSHGNLTKVTDPLSHETNFEYDTVGNVTARTDALGRRTSYTYDRRNLVLSITDPNNKITRFNYDPNGNLLTTTNALDQITRYAYDAKNRLISTTDPLNNVTRFTYNSADEMIAVRSPLGRITSYAYDGRGQIKTITDALGNAVRFTYDSRQNLTTLSDERNNVTTFVYDNLSRMVSKRDPLGNTTTYGYDAVGNAIETVDRMQRQTNFTYDALNRLKKAVYTDATVDYEYDSAGRLTRIVDTQGGTLQYAYDTANRLLSETMPAGTVSYTYNNADQRSSMSVENRPPVNYAYDPAGRLNTITQGTEVFTYSYDDLSRVSNLMRPNGIRTEYSYDTAGRLARLAHLDPLDQAVEEFNYTYNADNEIDSISSLFTPQLLASARTAGTADAANRITQFDGATYTYNLEGETTSKTDAQGTTTYSWDSRGRLTQAALPGGQTVEYGYDATGRRRSRTAGTQSTSFVYDGQDIVADRNSDGSRSDYVNGLNIDTKLGLYSTQGSLYFIPDHLGSTTALTNVSGEVIERQRYEVYGAAVENSSTRFGFAGRELEGETGLMYYRARWYDPNVGRFQSEDPSGYRSSTNLYHYVKNSPLIYRDPTGLVAWGNLGRNVASAVGYGAGVAGAAILSGFTGGAALAVVGVAGVRSAYGLGASIGNIINALAAENDLAYDNSGNLSGSLLQDLIQPACDTTKNLTQAADLFLDLVLPGSVYGGRAGTLIDVLTGLQTIDTVITNAPVQNNLITPAQNWIRGGPQAPNQPVRLP